MHQSKRSKLNTLHTRVPSIAIAKAFQCLFVNVVAPLKIPFFELANSKAVERYLGSKIPKNTILKHKVYEIKFQILD